MNANLMAVSSDPKSIAIRSIHNMARGSRADFDEVIAADGFTHTRDAAPPAMRGSGPGPSTNWRCGYAPPSTDSPTKSTTRWPTETSSP